MLPITFGFFLCCNIKVQLTVNLMILVNLVSLVILVNLVYLFG